MSDVRKNQTPFDFHPKTIANNTDIMVKVPSSSNSSVNTKDSTDISNLDFRNLDLNKLRFMEIDLLGFEKNS